MNRTVKISHRPQLVSHKRNARSPNTISATKSVDGIERGQKCDSGRKNW